MSAIPELPPELWAIRDAAVEHVLTNAPLPPDFERLHEWLEGDGWDALIGAWIDEEIALKLDYLAQLWFSDAEAVNCVNWLDSGDEITDEKRVNFARELIAENFYSDDGYINPGVFSFRVERKDGKSAIIGCTIEIHGQGGPVPVWHGVFPTREAFISHLKECGLWLKKDTELLDDSSILALWQKEKKEKNKTKKKANPKKPT